MLATPIRRPGQPRRTPFSRRSSRAAVVVAATALLAAVLLLAPSDLAPAARAALFAFGLAVLLWSVTRVPAAWAGLAAVLVLVALGGEEQDEVYESLGSAVVWVMIGAFVLGGAVQSSGLADRLTTAVTGRARTVGGLCWAVTAVLVPLSAVVPSTSGRAALLLPLHRTVSARLDDRRVSRALALLIPSIVLVSTICTLVGAGSHLVVVELLDEATGRTISFGQWLLWGAPVGVAASVVTCWAVVRFVLGREGAALPARVPVADTGPWSSAEVRTAAVAAALVVAWATEPLHGAEVAVVAVAGVVALTAPQVGVLSWREGVDAVSWNLVVFVGTALVLGEAMISSGAAEWLVSAALGVVGLDAGTAPLAAVAAIGVVALTSHLYMTSHAARSAALVPPVVLVAQQTGLDPVAAAFVATVGADFCLTLPVSSKALLLYAELDDHPLDRADLARLSAFMLPVHLALVVGAYVLWWQHVGLSL